MAAAVETKQKIIDQILGLRGQKPFLNCLGKRRNLLADTAVKLSMWLMDEKQIDPNQKFFFFVL